MECSLIMLTDNQITEDCAPQLADALTHNNALTSLLLDGKHEINCIINLHIVINLIAYKYARTHTARTHARTRDSRVVSYAGTRARHLACSWCCHTFNCPIYFVNFPHQLIIYLICLFPNNLCWSCSTDNYSFGVATARLLVDALERNSALLVLNLEDIYGKHEKGMIF